MKFSMLSSVVDGYVKHLNTCAAYSGAYNDGGSSAYNAKLEKFKTAYVYELDLRPSEYYKLDDLEVGEPLMFREAILFYKQQLVQNMKL